MEGRFVYRAALVVGLAASVVACAVKKPIIDKKAERAEDAEAKARAAQSVEKGIGKEVAPLGATLPPRHKADNVLHPGEPIWMQPGKSKVVQLPANVTRVSIGNPDLAGVVVLGPRSILINAKELPANDQQQSRGGSSTSRSGLLSSRTFTPPPTIAETSVILWDNANHTDAHTIYVADFLAEQVLLEVTVAELNRTKAEARGVDFQKLGANTRLGYLLGGGSVPGSLLFTPNAGGAGAPTLPLPFPLVTGPDRPTFVFQNKSEGITALITLLQTEGLATILAQPKIMALSGQNAVFQVGGEIPIRIVTSFSAEVEFKAFGTLVNFLPRVAEDGSIILTVTPEVSQPDFANTVEGVPTFRVRRASTTSKLREGETLVLGGLTQRNRIEQERGVPYLKDLPYLGALFRSTQYTEDVTELMVIATPRLVRPLEPDTDLDLPVDRPPMQREDVRTAPNPEEVTRPRLPTPAYDSSKKRKR